ncbi:amino acid ABC transporter permease [Bradyrhizobium sp. CCGUVB23]|uniref:amino acid ABC transporter permease n=1 Tax=Bradyrhizobium sp. CCGUVB23 TaxID=2949630 RepID=UPI0020B32585|nr:amino acid ABC transporter permease [Bradyrhizobium sp. CCGUVB23]MCP3460972.1 amino acid ABC transporter permease [Bradyrhizobium sp. CCGUVB23]MCP3463245.1 amino acid ABC transporter permease [Bradyrhizobium sp. CCGUVB23]
MGWGNSAQFWVLARHIGIKNSREGSAVSQEVVLDVAPTKASPFYDPKLRSIVVQVAIVVLLVFGLWWISDNTIENLRRSNIPTGFEFLNSRSGFEIPDRLIDYSSESSYGRALLVGIVNTARVAVLGIIVATIVGFVVGIGRLSSNWMIRKLATIYIEVFRNVPLLLVILFWYQGVLALLPNVRSSLALPFGSYLNNRGLYLPRLIWSQGAWLIIAGLMVAIGLSWYVARRAHARQMATGQQLPVFWVSVALLIGLPLLGCVLAGFPMTVEFPQKGTFMLTGGLDVKPEFLSLLLALSFYTASFIAEIVRAGIQGVPKGQAEAYSSLGIRPGQGLRLVIIPQALRIIIPLLTSQYLNLTKNSSLAVAVGYADLYAVGGTILNQTGRAIEVVVIFMVVYLGLSILTSLVMNWFNVKLALRQR